MLWKMLMTRVFAKDCDIMLINNNQQLERIAEKVSRESEYQMDIHVFFRPFEDFKIKWEGVRDSWVNIYLPDYMIGQPEEIIEELIMIAMDRVHGCINIRYSDRLCDVLTSDEMRMIQRPIFISRHNIEKNPFGSINGVPTYWTLDPIRTIGSASAAMGMISINCALKDAPKDIIMTAIKKIYSLLRDRLTDFNQMIPEEPVSQKEFDDLCDWMKWHGIYMSV